MLTPLLQFHREEMRISCSVDEELDRQRNGFQEVDHMGVKL
jgi:hypothetical protein